MHYALSHFYYDLSGASSSAAFYEALDYPMVIDAAFHAYGLVAIFFIPGMASLRVLRILTFMKYGKYLVGEDKSALVRYAVRSVQVCGDFLDKVAEELFTTKTKGAVVLLGMFFYFAYGEHLYSTFAVQF
jgi:hypothetical protein